jgi:hypothetical protein
MCNTRQRSLIISALRSTGLVEINDSYKVGSFSKGYRLGKCLRSANGIEIQPIESTKVSAKKVLKENSCFKLDFLQRQLNRLEISYESIQYILDKYRASVEDDYTLPMALRDLTVSFGVFTRTYPLLIRDTTSFRVHSFLTTLRSELRGFLRIRDLDEGLVNIDLKNSQLFFLNKMLQEKYPECRSTDDVKLFDELTSDGRFYEFVAQEMSIPDRDTVKKQIFRSYLFCKNRHCRKNYSSFMSAYFPNVHKCVTELKVENYKHLAISLQSTESRFMIDRIVPRLMNELTKADFIATIHDSIVTNESASTKVASIMLDEFAKDGLKPSIKIEGIEPKGGFQQDLKLMSEPEIVIQ